MSHVGKRLIAKTLSGLFLFVAASTWAVDPSGQTRIESASGSENRANEVGELPGYREGSSISKEDTIVSIIDASRTYKGFGFENALDSDAFDDYVASLDSLSAHYVVLRLKRPVSQGTLTLKWESLSNHPGRVEVFAVDVNGNVQKKLVALDIATGDDTAIRLRAAEAFQGIRIEFSKFTGQPRLLMRLIEFKPKGYPGIPWKGLVWKEGDDEPIGTWLGAGDPRNPLRFMRFPVTQKVKALSDALAAGITDDHEKIVAFMAYIEEFKLGTASAPTPDATIEERKGACSSFSSTLLAFAAAQGLEGRMVNLQNYPENDGHTVVEIRLGDKWALYDPSFSAFYTLSDYQRPLSFEEIRAGYESGLDVRLHHNSHRVSLDRFAGREIFVQANPAGLVAPDSPLLFPLHLSMTGQHSVNEAQFGPRWQGADYLGAASRNQQQIWTLQDLEPGGHYTFDVIAKNIGGDLSANDHLFVLTARIHHADGTEQRIVHQFDFTDGQPQSWKIPLFTRSDALRVELLHDYRGPQYRYITMQGYRLHEAD